MKGMCFIEPLFHKVAKGEKTQTRRIIANCDSLRESVFVKSGYETCHGRELKPKYKVGEVVYLKEPYVITGKYIIYKFGSTIGRECDNAGVKWSNKLFMPESAARYFIKIIAVRAERLQEISEEDCIKEGIDSFFNPLFSETRYKDYLNPNSECRSPQSSYASLINKINGKGTWESNPWVWVYDFELFIKQ